MTHKIPSAHIDSLILGPSASKTTQVATLQNFIQQLLGETHHTFLQGSYVNDTAIRDINDVDIVAVRKTTYSAIHSPYRFDQSILWNDIFTEIERKLKDQSKYTWVVERGDKCIKIRGAFNVDVIPAVKVDHDHTTDPIVIYSHKTQIERPNFPRTFYDNGVAKNKATNQLYKPMVRMFKNWAINHFDDDKIISSFKIQALAYGVSNEKFQSDHAAGFILVGSEMLKALETSRPIMSVCGAEDINMGWDQSMRSMFVSRLRQSVTDALDAYRATHAGTAETFWKKALNL